MQRTTRQGQEAAARDLAALRTAARTNAVVAPSYPLLRMTLFAMANLTAAYTTLITVPTLLMTSDETTGSSSSSTLPSLFWTIAALFVFQTTVGLVQSYLHSSNQQAATVKKGKSSSRLSSSSSLLASIVIGTMGTAVCYAFVVLFGAGFIHQAMETALLACYLSLLSFYPASFVLKGDLTSWLRIFVHNSPQTYTETALYCQGMMAIFGAWLGSIVIPLDWDRPWQVWPVPCVLGAILFYSIGAIVGLVVSVVMRQRAMRSEFGIDNVKNISSQKAKDD
ncbi:hypothetical protein BGZ65_008167 [Modicella reniformis]|uniref:Uncharacterized protein n=1 Tax=Modicella reniformis TaxID=1440133 RepID=A0A9P6IJK4_9FUNG|nr:hypothetical protein BGZ65_008167 [Modicella reniformis]